MRTNIRFALVVLAFAMFFETSTALAQAQSPAAGSCLTDLQTIPAFLLTNDAGARDHLAQLGQIHFDDAMAEAQKSAGGAANPGECAKAINQYLRSWRKGHLWVAVTPQGGAARDEILAPPDAGAAKVIDPSFRELSPKTILLTLPSFYVTVHDKLEALLKEHHEAVVSHPNWIIDVRDNDGGSDSGYQPLLPWLMPDEMVVHGMEWFATPASIQDYHGVCAIYAPGNKECEDWANRVAGKMAKAPAGTWVTDGDQGIYYQHADSVEPRRPSRVAVLIDHPCGSSCEQFVLTVRQSFAVKLIGRHTFGCLDYSNLVAHTLPSGNLRLWYTTSRTLRIPEQPVDVTGILPDIYLPLGKGPTAKDDEIKRVQNWLEGGSLAPLNTADARPQAK